MRKSVIGDKVGKFWKQQELVLIPASQPGPHYFFSGISSEQLNVIFNLIPEGLEGKR